MIMTLDIQYVESEGEDSTASTDWQEKAKITWTPPAEGYYVILASAEVKNSVAAGGLAETQVTVDGVEVIEQIENTPTNYSPWYEYHNFSFATYMKFDNTEHDIVMNYASNGTGTTYIRRARIIVIEIPTHVDIVYDIKASETSALGTWTTKCSIDLPAGDWLILGSAQRRNSNNHQDCWIRVRNLTDSEDLHEPCLWDNYIASCHLAHLQMKVITLTEQKTIALQFRRDAGGTAFVKNSALIAINLEKWKAYEYDYEESQQNTNGAYVAKLTQTFTPAVEANYLMIAFWTQYNSNGACQTQVRDGSTEICYNEHNQGSSYISCGYIRRDLLSTTPQTFDIRIRREGGTVSARVKNLRLFQLRLEVEEEAVNLVSCDGLIVIN